MAMSTSKRFSSLKCSFENAPLGFPYIQSLPSLRFLEFSEQSSSLSFEQFPRLGKVKYPRVPVVLSAYRVAP
jgi:hypothetical protein